MFMLGRLIFCVKTLDIPQYTASLPRPIEIACVKRTDVIRRQAELRINLELQDGRYEIFDVVLIRYDVIFCTRIEMRARTGERRDQTLKPQS